MYTLSLIYDTWFILCNRNLDGLLIAYNDNYVDKTITEDKSSNMFQNLQLQITNKKGAVNKNLERNVDYEPICNYTISCVIKSSKGKWIDVLFFSSSNEQTAIKLLCIENKM
jgi:hypothetical protein